MTDNRSSSRSLARPIRVFVASSCIASLLAPSAAQAQAQAGVHQTPPYQAPAKAPGERSASLALLDVTVNVPQARVEIDGVAAGVAPLAEPLRVASGTHLVAVIAEGFVPERREVFLASGVLTPLRFELLEMRGRRLANLTLRSNVAGAEVVVDERVAARTPLVGPLALAPGQHRIELRRPGYRPKLQTLELGDGATQELSWQLEIEPLALASVGASVTLVISESDAHLTLDGAASGVYSGPLRLPAGLHHLRLERAGFRAWEGDIDVSPERPNVFRVQLEPTPETRAQLAHSARVTRTWGVTALTAGLVLNGIGVGWLMRNARSKRSAQSAVDAIEAQAEAGSGRCDTSSGTITPDQCNAAVHDAHTHLDDMKKRDVYGWVGVGAGMAATLTGVILLARAAGTGTSKSGPERSAARFELSPWLAAGTGGALLRGEF